MWVCDYNDRGDGGERIHAAPGADCEGADCEGILRRIGSGLKPAGPRVEWMENERTHRVALMKPMPAQRVSPARLGRQAT